MKLAEFAAQHGRVKGCKVCALPKELIKEVNAGLTHSVPIFAISRWLTKDQNHPVGRTAIERHKDNCLEQS